MPLLFFCLLKINSGFTQGFFIFAAKMRSTLKKSTHFSIITAKMKIKTHIVCLDSKNRAFFESFGR